MSNETSEHGPHSVQVISVGLTWMTRFLLVALTAGGAILGNKWLRDTAPKRERRPVQERSAVVEVTELKRVAQKTLVRATGTVIPVRQLALTARVSGEVVKVSSALEPGGRIAIGEVAVELDQSDYDLAVSRAKTQVARAKSQLAHSQVSLAQSRSQVAQAESKLVTAQYNHQVELGYQDVAKHEWEMLDSKTTATELERELTLRKPHLRKAVAEVTSAEAGIEVAKAAIKAAESAVTTSQASVADAEVALAQAELALTRTSVRIPFNAVVLERAVSVGAQVAMQTQLAVLVDADAFWVEVSVPAGRVPWIAVRDGTAPGAAVVLRPSGAMAEQAEWHGEVVRRLPSLEEKGRLARVLVEVPNPLSAGKMPLLLGAFVQAEIAGPELKEVFVIPRATMHNGNQVWLRNGEGRLKVSAVELEWSDADVVVVRDGLEEGAMLVTSGVASPVPGMQLALAGEEGPPDAKESPGPKPGSTPPVSKGKGGRP